jgi:hypothetical protein
MIPFKEAISRAIQLQAGSKDDQPIHQGTYLMTTFLKPLAFAASLMSSAAFADPGAYLEITLKIAPENREAAAAIYTQYREPFLTTVAGAESKVLLVREDDVQVLHGFDTVASAMAYLDSELFTNDVFVALKPLVMADPEVRVYQAN